MKLPLVVNAALGVSRPLSSAARRFRMRGADPHLLWLPSRPQPVNNAASVSPPNEQWHKDTLMYSPGLFFFFLLGVQADENGWEKNAYVFVISQSFLTFRRSKMVSAQDGHPGA